MLLHFVYLINLASKLQKSIHYAHSRLSDFCLKVIGNDFSMFGLFNRFLTDGYIFLCFYLPETAYSEYWNSGRYPRLRIIYFYVHPIGMDLDEYESVLASLQSLKSKVHSALESINKTSVTSPGSSSSSSTTITPRPSNNLKPEPDKTMKNTESLTKPSGPTEINDPSDRATVKAQREAKKAAKAAKKQGIKVLSSETPAHPIIAQSKPMTESIKNVVETKKPKEDTGKSKAELKAERRALQEAQREAKNKPDKKGANAKPEEKPQQLKQGASIKVQVSESANTSVSVKNIGIPASKSSKQSISPSRIIENLFNSIPTFTNNFVGDEIHPLFRHLGVKFSHGLVHGSNTRCVLLMDTIDKFITQEYRTPVGKELKHDLPLKLKPNLAHLKSSGSFAVAMENALESLNGMIAESAKQDSDEDVKELLHEKIQGYIEEKIVKAKESIVLGGKEKIHCGDKILVYSMTEVLQSVVIEASKDIQFELIVICAKNTDEDGMFSNGSAFSRWLGKILQKKNHFGKVSINC